MPHSLHPLIESSILLASTVAVALNFFLNDGKGETKGSIAAATQAEARQTLLTVLIIFLLTRASKSYPCFFHQRQVKEQLGRLTKGIPLLGNP